MAERRNALVVGATGIVGGNICERLIADGWTVHGMARRPERSPKGTLPLPADLNDRQAVADAIASADPVSHLFQASWTPADTEEEACRINAQQLSNVLDGLKAASHPVQHVVLITGVKHYL